MFENLIMQFVQLVGVAALVAALVNVAKTFGLPDGYAPQVSAGLSLIAFIGMVAAHIFAPNVDFALLDEKAADFAVAILYILGLLVQLGLPAKFHEMLASARVPLFGKSYSYEAADEFDEAVKGV